MINIKPFLIWLFGHFHLPLLFVPLSARYIAVPVTRDGRQFHIGYQDFYIFGLRIARIQKTKPWDNIHWQA